MRRSAPLFRKHASSHLFLTCMQASLHDMEEGGNQIADGYLPVTATPELGFMRFALYSSSTNQAIGEVSFVIKPG